MVGLQIESCNYVHYAQSRVVSHNMAKLESSSSSQVGIDHASQLVRVDKRVGNYYNLCDKTTTTTLLGLLCKSGLQRLIY